jgi:hypothetical protein
MIRINNSIFDILFIGDLLDDNDGIFWIYVIVEEAMTVITKFDIFTKESNLLPTNVIHIIIDSHFLFKLIDTYPRKDINFKFF